MLSVATAPVDARQRFVATAVIFVLTAASFALFPVASTLLPPAPAVVPLFLGIALASNFVTAYLLFSQFVANRLLGTAFLGGSYVVGGLLGFVYVLTLPTMFGTTFAPQVAPWIWIVWHFDFPLTVCLALWFDYGHRVVHETKRVRPWIRAICAGAIAFAALPVVALTVRGSALATIVDGTSYAWFGRSGVGEVLVVVNLFALALAIMWTRGRTVLHTWLIVALAAACLDVQMALVGGSRFSVGWYFARFLIVCSSTAVLYAYLRQMHVMFAQLSDLSMFDGLTGLANRRSFEARLHDEIRAARRMNRPLAVVIADVDVFKQYNDTYGHLAGDEALRAVASALRVSMLRPGDVLARWGGEEFIAFLSETDREGAYQVAERLRAAVAALAIPHRRSSVRGNVVTISAGVATLGGPDDALDALVDRADAALYRAKNAGRNTVAVELTPAVEAVSAAT
ncbi:MAG TPA: sensor domain-containing diguanylate cyclase [Candidatus Elarobacter sp.]|jgi:diguanylate cyclase (GGDEF)-like protein